MKIREGKPTDRALFSMLWMEYLRELYAMGGDTLPTAHSLSFFVDRFEEYTEGRIAGVVLFGPDDQSVLMWGTPNPALDLTYGVTGSSWGTYVRPSHRHRGESKHLRIKAVEKLRVKGIDAVMGGYVLANEAGVQSSHGFGFKPVSQCVVLKLKE